MKKEGQYAVFMYDQQQGTEKSAEWLVYRDRVKET